MPPSFLHKPPHLPVLTQAKQSVSLQDAIPIRAFEPTLMAGDQPGYFLFDICRRECVEVGMRVFERESIRVREVRSYVELKLEWEIEKVRWRRQGLEINASFV